MRLVIPAKAGTYPFAPIAPVYAKAPPTPSPPNLTRALYPRPNSLTLTRTR